MPTLTPEEEEQLQRKGDEIRHIWQHCRAYPYRQRDLLERKRKYRKSDGICQAMSIDWLRRLLFNDFKMAAKRKRNFDDPKYMNSIARQNKLVKKQFKLHDTYLRRVEEGDSPDLQTIVQAMAKTGLTKSGMDKLHCDTLLRVPSYMIEESPPDPKKPYKLDVMNTHIKFREIFSNVMKEAHEKLQASGRPALGILWELGVTDGHTMAFYITAASDRFFDANLGEYHFTPAQRAVEEVQFISQLWFDIYLRFYKFTNQVFSSVTYGAPDVAADLSDSFGR